MELTNAYDVVSGKSIVLCVIPVRIMLWVENQGKESDFSSLDVASVRAFERR